MRILHTMLRVGDLPRSIAFYCDVLGMKVLRTTERPEQKYTLAFVGYGDEAHDAVIELTYNWDTHHYELGTGFGHIAIGVDDIYATCTALREKGVKVVREPGPMKDSGTHLAFIEDPDGYRIELIQRSNP